MEVCTWKDTHRQQRHRLLISPAAMRPKEVSDLLQLDKIAKDHVWKVEPSCATTGEGIFEGLVIVTCPLSAVTLLTIAPGMALKQRQATTGRQVDIGLCVASPVHPSPVHPSRFHSCTTACALLLLLLALAPSCIYPGVSFLSSYSPYNLIIHG